jgi:3-phosphoshikimate 1-carboxyvinyltransferase
MTESVSPARRVHGVVNVPGDKSISHRYAMLTAIAEGDSQIFNFATGADCHSTLACMRELGVEHKFSEQDGRQVLTVHGRGLHGLRGTERALDAGNSGSTIRMLSGILAGQPFMTTIGGDESLSRRPMARVIKPLSRMGARIDATSDQYPPLTIHGSELHAIDYELPVASAQVKSSVLLAALYANGETTVREPTATRDHTEIALAELGADITTQRRVIKIRGGAKLTGKTLAVPGDVSSATFFLVAALILPDSDVILTNVGLNPTRTALLDFLRAGGADIKLLHIEQINGELVGNLQVRASTFTGGVIQGQQTAALIDEIPALAVLGAASRQGLSVRDAAELRVKETDRIATIALNFGRMGIQIETFDDGFTVPGNQKFRAGELDSQGDHRIAMAFAVAALAAHGPCTIQNAEAASVSYPEFFATLRSIAQ